MTDAQLKALDQKLAIFCFACAWAAVAATAFAYTAILFGIGG